MRYVSQHANFIKSAVKPVKQLVSSETGPRIIEEGGVICQFQWGGLRNYELEAALDRFELRGLALGRTPQARFSHYDTDVAAAEKGWDTETKQKVERFLTENQNEAYFLIEAPTLAPPWPAYDTLVPQGQRTIGHIARTIVDKVQEDGYDVELVLDYERQNKAREPVIEALEGLRDAQKEPDELTITA